MTDKEVLAELKVCYELLNDIRENNEGRFDDEEDTILWKIGEQIDDLYSKVYRNAINSEYKDELLKYYRLSKTVDAILIDIHGETASEKLALGYYLDGKVSIVAGTHTHVPTADARILPNKTGYITDVGMCGDFDSILGFEIQTPIDRLTEKFTAQSRLVPANGKELTIWGVLADIDDNGLCQNITQIRETFTNL